MDIIPKETLDWLKKHHFRKERGRLEWWTCYGDGSRDAYFKASTFSCFVRADQNVDGDYGFHAAITVSKPKAAYSIDSFLWNIDSPLFGFGDATLAFSEAARTPEGAVREAFRKLWLLFDALCGMENSRILIRNPQFYNLANFERTVMG